jgi:hypothetical protein
MPGIPRHVVNYLARLLAAHHRRINTPRRAHRAGPFRQAWPVKEKNQRSFLRHAVARGVQNTHIWLASMMIVIERDPPRSAVILSPFCISPGHEGVLRLGHVADVRFWARIRTQERSDKGIDAGHVRDIASGAS